MLLPRIETDEDVAAALDALCAADPRLAAIRAEVPTVPLRRRPHGLDGLLRVIVGQQLSIHAAAAIWETFERRVGAITPEAVLALSDPELQSVGLSRAKIATFRSAAEAVAAGLDLEALGEGPVDEALEALMAIKGVGLWTANVYMMFCAGHPDIFPVGDLALRRAVAAALGLEGSPDPEAIAAVALAWSPHRSTAARLMWAYYRHQRDEKRRAAGSRGSRGGGSGARDEALPV